MEAKEIARKLNKAFPDAAVEAALDERAILTIRGECASWDELERSATGRQSCLA